MMNRFNQEDLLAEYLLVAFGSADEDEFPDANYCKAVAGRIAEYMDGNTKYFLSFLGKLAE